MPGPAFCALEDVYSDWNFENTQKAKQNHPSLRPTQTGPTQTETVGSAINQNQLQDKLDQQEQVQEERQEPSNGLRSFCPNCKSCLNANNMLQQRIVEVNTWPHPRWEPQYPNAYVPYDPFNRYWMNNVPPSHREDFGNVFENFGKSNNTEALLQIILFILIALFIVQLVECLYMRTVE